MARTPRRVSSTDLLDMAFVSDPQLAPGGHMVFVVVSKEAPQYRQGTRLDDDWYELPFESRTELMHEHGVESRLELERRIQELEAELAREDPNEPNV